MREYSIYIIKNTVNKKVYIGQTCQSVHTRFMQHMKPSVTKQRGSYKIYNAINKYGKDKFYVETLETGLTSEEADEREIYYIEQYNSFENGYNSTRGADTKTISKIEDVEYLKTLYESKMLYKDMAKIFNVNVATIVRTLNDLGIKRRMKVTKDYLLNNLNKTNKEMAKELNVDDYTITRAFKRYGIPRGTGCSNHLKPQNQKGYRKKFNVDGQLSLFN